MARYIKIIYIFFLFVLSACGQSNAQDKILLSSFKQIAMPFLLADTVDFLHWENPIDTILVKKHSLVDGMKDSLFPLKNLSSYQCSAVGSYQLDDIAVIVYKIYTTEAGNGNPLIILRTLDKNLNKKDQLIILWENPEDLFWNQRSFCTINSDSISINLVETTNGFLDKKLVLKRIKENKIVYFIDKEGNIKKIRDFDKILYNDNNSRITQDSPQ